MYSLSGFGSMINDGIRMDAYVRALEAVVRPGSVVLDIGTGPGFFAVLACRLGARRVVAVDPSDSIHLAREIAFANGCANSIEFRQALSTEIELDEPADVIVSDLRGVLPLLQGHIHSLVDARTRLLAPGGVLIPQKDSLFLSIIEDPVAYARVASPWSDRPFGLDLEPGRRIAANQWWKIEPVESQLLSVPSLIGELDYRTIEAPDFSGQALLSAFRDGEAHGICAWFDACLLEGIGFSNAPGAPDSARAIYGCAFFPFSRALSMAAGDQLRVEIHADLVNAEYLWRWSAQLLDASSGTVWPVAKYSSLGGEMLSASGLRKRAASYVPDLSQDGEVDLYVLQLMRQRVVLEEIARRLSAEHPRLFPDWHLALARVGALSRRYSR